MSTPVVFSGIQPTGSLTIGNYIGAIRGWIALQHHNDCVFCLVDLHALTIAQDPAALHGRCLDYLSLYLACGVDPERSIVFVQSHVPAHAQMAWLLGCFTSMGELGRMTQYKEKVRRNAKNLSVGLFTYPVLMAADILLYGASLVPVGEDQRQHVELVREIATRFNRRFGPVFQVPEAVIGMSGGRVRSLLDPLRKMSKTDENPRSYIALLDPPDAVRQKIMAAVTGSGRGYGPDDASPGIGNLVSIMASLREVAPETVAAEYEGRGYAVFKKDLSDALIEVIEPIRRRFAEIRGDETALREILARGADRARTRAGPTLARAFEKVGLLAAS